jgi:hypothetical protein
MNEDIFVSKQQRLQRTEDMRRCFGIFGKHRIFPGRKTAEVTARKSASHMHCRAAEFDSEPRRPSSQRNIITLAIDSPLDQAGGGAEDISAYCTKLRKRKVC